MIDITIEENKAVLDKININAKTFNVQNQFSTIKCYQSLTNITNLEAKGVNIIKIHKTIYLNLPNLTHIDLRDNKLIKLSKNFKLFKNLISLRLDNNNIMFIPSFISEFTKLEVLSISNNNLTSIPASIQYLTNLKTFKFSNNQITKLPIEFGQLKSLEVLHLDGNYYTEIPTTLCYLRKLVELTFEWPVFLDPPFYKTLKEAMGKTFINIIRSSLQEMIKNSILYCDFNTFIERISTNKKKDKKALNDNNNNNTHNNDNKGNANTNRDNNHHNNVISNNSNTYEQNNVSESGTWQRTSMLPNKNNNDNNNNNNNTHNNDNDTYMIIFSAVENNYYGVVKALLETSVEYFKVKNKESKTPFYMAIHNKNDDMINLFLSKIDLTHFPLSHVYFHKAIRMRNPELVKKLVQMGIAVNSTDDQGSGCFHVLFSVFTKQLSRCALIADFLLEKHANVNNYNNDNWAPIHIAARKASKECLLWILSSNKRLRKEGREEFNLNLTGKNRWTPLHLTVNSFRLEETLILLENGCDVFARNLDLRTPKKVSNGNYLFTKLLTNFENKKLEYKYKEDENTTENGNNAGGRCYTIVDGEEDESDESKVPFKYNSNKEFKAHTNKLRKTNQQFIMTKAQTFNNHIQKHNDNNESVSLENRNNINNNNNNISGCNKQFNVNVSQQSLGKEEKSITPSNSFKKFQTNASNFLNLDKINNIKTLNSILTSNNNNTNTNNSNIQQKQQNQQQQQHVNDISSNNNNHHNAIINDNFLSPNLIEQNNDDNSPLSSCLSDESGKTKENIVIDKDNIELHKNILLNTDSNIFEKYEAFMFIKLSKQDITTPMKVIIDNLDLECDMNLVLLSDICSFCVARQMVELHPMLSQLAKNELLAQRNNFIVDELKNTVKILESN